MTVIVFGLLAFSVVLWWLTRCLPVPPEPMSEEQLRAEGMKPAQIRAELRHQRQELRSHVHARAHSVRAASQAARLAVRLAKKL